jgi:fucokinase
MNGVVARMMPGMLVCSGDVLLLFNPLQLNFHGKGATALSMKESADTGKEHGVYIHDNHGNVGQFLHKQSINALRQMGAMDARGNVDIDIGVNPKSRRS